MVVEKPLDLRRRSRAFAAGTSSIRETQSKRWFQPPLTKTVPCRLRGPSQPSFAAFWVVYSSSEQVAIRGFVDGHSILLVRKYYERVRRFLLLEFSGSAASKL
jgi:hypothetical protein